MIHRRHARIAGQAIFGGLTDAAATTAFLARTSGLDATHIAAYKALINGLVADGVWAKLDLLQIYATQDQTTANLNLISTSFTASPQNAPTWGADVGYTTAAGKWVDCNWNPATDAIQFSQDACHICVWSGTSGRQTNAALGLKTTTNGQLRIGLRSNPSDTAFAVMNDTSAVTSPASLDGSGFFVGVRKDANTKQLFRNGSQMGGDITRSSLTPQSFTLQTAGDNVNSANSTAMIVRAAGAGGLLTPTDVSNYYSRISTFMSAVGATP